ncbi:MAG: ABC transporter substrate-binding protein [Actinomycetota bacterium]|nr:ABC transporter substrate-binding protein [Actinomycetota bacterium]
MPSSRAPFGRLRAGQSLLALAFCAFTVLTPALPGAAATPSPNPKSNSWAQIEQAAKGQTVSLWMWGGDPQGNAYVDDVLTPAASTLGVTLKRVPITDTKDALNRILAEHQAGRTDGSVDLVWVNGDNFRTGLQAGIWKCNWADRLPNMTYTAPPDPLLTSDFGTPVGGCESPWHKAQFTFAYNAARVPHPPTSMPALMSWITAHPGRFTYPAPPDFTGSVFVREALYAVSGGFAKVPAQFSQSAYDQLTPALWRKLDGMKPALWRHGQTYPKDSTQLDQLFAGGEVDFTMTYGPATLTSLVAKGTFPKSTRVLTLDEGTVGNASFLAIPTTSGNSAGAQVVANLALSPQQQAIKADPRTWGQFTVLDVKRLSKAQAHTFASLPKSPVVPNYSVLSRHANPELAAAWVPRLDEGWRRNVLTDSG